MHNTLALFNYDWDAAGADRLRARGYRVDSRGFDLFNFPSNVNLAFFDLDRFVSKLAKQAVRQGWQGVMSQHEQFGALAAALLAQKMGWAGTAPEAVVACQHKLYARDVLQRVAPEANIRFERLPCRYGEDIPADLRFPAFIKPVKAAFSVLAQTMHTHADLQRFTRFGPWELWVIRHLVEPFERVSRRLIPEAGTAHSMMLEEPVSSHRCAQYSLDGIAFNGHVKPLGVVDSIMYPGTQAFMRFDYPSKLAEPIQARALDVAQRFLKAVGFTHGLFNMEFFYDMQADRLAVIEFNPRMASQFADLYQRVDGLDLYGMAHAMAHGKDPWAVPRSVPTAGAASSFVYRVFDQRAAHLPQRIPAMPSQSVLGRLRSECPDHLLLSFPKDEYQLYRDFKWLGSYRYGILHLGGRDAHDLRERCERASRLLGWLAPYADHLCPETSQPPMNQLLVTS
jgi:hypothetical protein